MEIRALEQWYRMNKANNFTEFYNALGLQGLSMFNIVYADRNDTIFYINNGLIPVRDSNPSLDWKKTIPGNSSQTLWTRFHRVNELPQYINPQSGFLFNTNHSPFYATATEENLQPSKFPIQNGWETNHNNRSKRFLELMPLHGKLDFGAFKAIKFDRQLPSTLHYPYGVDTLFLLDPKAYPLYDTLLHQLKTWDKKGDANSKGAAVFLMVYESVSSMMRGKSERQLTKAESLQVLEGIYQYMKLHFGRLDPTLGDIQKLVRGDKTYPGSGLPDLLSPEWGIPQQNGTRKITGGDAYVAMVRFPKNGLPIIETVNTYGASSKLGSKHFDDQVPLFLEQKTKTMSLDKQVVLKNAIRIYHPGDNVLVDQSTHK